MLVKILNNIFFNSGIGALLFFFWRIFIWKRIGTIWYFFNFFRYWQNFVFSFLSYIFLNVKIIDSIVSAFIVFFLKLGFFFVLFFIWFLKESKSFSSIIFLIFSSFFWVPDILQKSSTKMTLFLFFLFFFYSINLYRFSFHNFNSNIILYGKLHV